MAENSSNHHHHHHHHHHHTQSIGPELKKIYLCAIVLNGLFVLFEMWMGYKADSVSLVSDAAHKLIDVLSLGLVLLTFYLSKTKATRTFTFGYRKVTVLTSLLNALLVVFISIHIIVESVEKLVSPEHLSPDGGTMSLVASVGVIVNILTAFILSIKRKHDLNTKGAFIHVLTDALLSIGVVIAGLVIKNNGTTLLDPVFGIIIAVAILISIWSVLRDSFRLIIDGVPSDISMEEVVGSIRGVPGVKDVHHIHIWAISTTQTALSATIVMENYDNVNAVLRKIKHKLKESGIDDSTLEIELSSQLTEAGYERKEI